MKNSISFSILFWTNKAKAGTNGHSLKKKINPKNWNAKSGFIKGSSEETRNLNKYLIEINNERRRIGIHKTGS